MELIVNWNWKKKINEFWPVYLICELKAKILPGIKSGQKWITTFFIFITCKIDTHLTIFLWKSSNFYVKFLWKHDFSSIHAKASALIPI